jgi:hypothetical protein
MLSWSRYISTVYTCHYSYYYSIYYIIYYAILYITLYYILYYILRYIIYYTILYITLYYILYIILYITLYYILYITLSIVLYYLLYYILNISYYRARLANQLSRSGKNWAEIFSLYHSGTYVNQWMVMDWKRFSPGHNPSPGFLTILEEVPGYIHYEDKTDHLIVCAVD